MAKVTINEQAAADTCHTLRRTAKRIDMGGSRHQGEVPSVVCREPLVDQVDVEAAGRLRPRLLRHNASRAKAGFRCLVVDWRREAKRGVRRGQISAANERSDSAEGSCGHLNGGKEEIERGGRVLIPEIRVQRDTR